MKEATLSETVAYLRSPAIHHAISLLGPEFNFVDYLDGENALFQDIAAKFSKDVPEGEETDEDEEGETEEEGESEEEEEEVKSEEHER